MKKAIKVARFEFVEKARTKAFIIFVILFPLIIGAVSIVPALLVQNNKDKKIIVGILDYTDSYISDFIGRLNENKLSNGMDRYTVVDFYKPGRGLDSLKAAADDAVYKGIVEGYLILKDSSGITKASFIQSQFFPANDFYAIEKIINEILIQQKLSRIGYESDMIEKIVRDIKLNTVEIDAGKDLKSLGFQTVFFPAMVSLLLLFMLILFSGGQLIRSVMEEKSNRIMEILLSSCSSEELLMGKVLGLGMLGLFQVFIWAAIAFLLLLFHVIPREIFTNVGLISVYFVLGYLLYTSIFVGAGSVVSTEQEAQHFTSYISIIMTLPLIISLKVIENPNLMFVKILSFLPLTSPPVMLLRLKILTPPVWEIILTILILIVSIYFTIYVSAKIFRIGILSNGKHPSFKELYSWVREK